MISQIRIFTQIILALINATTPTRPGGLRIDGHGYNAGGFGAGAVVGFGDAAYADLKPSQQIMDRNVSRTYSLQASHSTKRFIYSVAMVHCQ